ncbi:GMC oxidoreductase [Bradyrhizobium liaoningense]
MIVALDHLPDKTISGQIVVIGAGAVGILVATELASKGLDVILLESGMAALSKEAADLNRSIVVGRAHNGIHEGRARVLGGTTTLWGGQLTTFSELDFQARPWVGADAWPISLANVGPYYQRVAEKLSLPATASDDEAVWSSLGLKVPTIGPEFSVILTRWLRTPNFAHYFEREMASLPNLRVVTGATVVSLDTDSTTGTVHSAKVRSLGGASSVLKANVFILANGTIEASRLMLHSAAENPSVPWANNYWVGAAFQDHLDYRAAHVTPLDRQAFSDIFDNLLSRGYKYQPKIALTNQAQRQFGSVNIAAAFLYNSSLREHLSNLKMMVRSLRSGRRPEKFSELPNHLKALGAAWKPIILRYLRSSRIHNLSDLGIQVVLHCEQIPVAESRIRLSDTATDANGMRRVSLDWRVHGAEVESMARFCETLDRRFRERGLARLEIAPELLARDQSTLDNCKDTNHHCGGLRMSFSPGDGVTNSVGQVHGAPNLFVAGAATFPSSSFANPTFTAMALGLRLCDYVSNVLR